MCVCVYVCVCVCVCVCVSVCVCELFCFVSIVVRDGWSLSKDCVLKGVWFANVRSRRREKERKKKKIKRKGKEDTKLITVHDTHCYVFAY